MIGIWCVKTLNNSSRNTLNIVFIYTLIIKVLLQKSVHLAVRLRLLARDWLNWISKAYIYFPFLITKFDFSSAGNRFQWDLLMTKR